MPLLEEFKYADITRKIIGCAMSAHSYLGNACLPKLQRRQGFQEIIYQKALAYEFQLVQLEFERELEMDIFYKDMIEPLGTRRVDFVVEDKVLVELKATTELEPSHYAQVLNYLRAFKLEVGLLINFGEKSLKYKRLILTPNRK